MLQRNGSNNSNSFCVTFSRKKTKTYVSVAMLQGFVCFFYRDVCVEEGMGVRCSQETTGPTRFGAGLSSVQLNHLRPCCQIFF